MHLMAFHFYVVLRFLQILCVFLAEIFEFFKFFVYFLQKYSRPKRNHTILFYNYNRIDVMDSKYNNYFRAYNYDYTLPV